MSMDMHGEHPPCPEWPHLHTTLSQEMAGAISAMCLLHIMDEMPPPPEMTEMADVMAQHRPLLELQAARARSAMQAGEIELPFLLRQFHEFADVPLEQFKGHEDEE